MLEVRHISPSLLKPWQDNPRINDSAVDAVARSIESFGFNVPILCDKDLTIIAGHTRWKATKRMAMKSVPVIVLQMSDSQCKAFAVADNKTGEIAEWDFPKLCEVLEELESQEINLSSLGYSEAELQALLMEEKDFNWTTFDEQLLLESGSDYVLYPIKIPAEMKETFKVAMDKCIREHQIAEKDIAVAAGSALGILLGVCR